MITHHRRGREQSARRYDTPERIAAIARVGFWPTPAKRRLVGGTPASHYALANCAPALIVVGDGVRTV